MDPWFLDQGLLEEDEQLHPLLFSLLLLLYHLGQLRLLGGGECGGGVEGIILWEGAEEGEDGGEYYLRQDERNEYQGNVLGGTPRHVEV